MNEPYVTLPVQVKRDEFWSSIMGSVFETWGWWDVEFRGGATWESPGETGYVHARLFDPDTGETEAEKDVHVADLAVAAAECERLDWHDYDASDGDCIMQTAVAGTIVFG